MSKDTLFTNDVGAAGGAVDYVKDVFQDVSLPPTSNSGLTDTASTNPLGYAFADDDSVKYGAKTLYIKDLVLIEDRSKWVSNKPTYRIIWNENFPAVNGYVFGNVTTYGLVKTIGDGIGVTGVCRRVQFIVKPSTAAAATGQVVVDGANGNTIDFSALSSDSDTFNPPKKTAFIHASSNVTKDIHDFRLTALQASTLTVVGVVVYFENSGSNVDAGYGTTYVNKNKVTTTAGATLSLPTPGSSLGAMSVVYKTTSSQYALSALSCSTPISFATGTTGTNLVTVTTGDGSSFTIGCGVVINQGTSHYVGNVLSISTDTLTMGATLPWGASAPIYKVWQSGSTYAINASLMSLAYSVDFSKYYNQIGASLPIFDNDGNWALWGNGIGVTIVDATVAAALTNAGALQVEGDFSAAEIEMIGNGIFHATLSINGLPSWNINAGQTGAIKRTIFTEAGPGWNAFNVGFGNSMGTVGINKINLYKRSRNIGISYGLLAEFPTNQSFVNRGTINATMSSLGLGKRLFSDQLYFKGSWVRGASSGLAGNARYVGASTTSVFRQEYYGKDFSIIGTVPTSGGTLTLDGSGIGLTFNIMQSVASEGFHTVQFTVASGTTSTIEAFDYIRSIGELKSLQKISNESTAPIKSVDCKYSASTTTITTAGATVVYTNRQYDDSGCYDSSTGIYTVKKRGRYRVTAAYFCSGTVTAGTNSSVSMRVFRNGLNESNLNTFLFQAAATALTPNTCNGGTVYAQKDDKLNINIIRGGGVSGDFALDGTNASNFICIEYLGD